MFQVLCRWSHRFLRYDFHPTRTGLPILQHTHTLARARSIVMSLPKTHSNQCNTLTTQQRKTRGGGGGRSSNNWEFPTSWTIATSDKLFLQTQGKFGSYNLTDPPCLQKPTHARTPLPALHSIARSAEGSWSGISASREKFYATLQNSAPWLSKKNWSLSLSTMVVWASLCSFFFSLFPVNLDGVYGTDSLTEPEGCVNVCVRISIMLVISGWGKEIWKSNIVSVLSIS